MEGLCVKLFNSWRLKINFLFPLRVSALRLEPPSHYLFLPKRGLHGKRWEPEFVQTLLGTRLHHL